MIDAIDTISSKIDLVLRCKAEGVPIISSMGAGNKMDPAAFKVGDIYETSIDPIAKVMRRELRKRGVRSLKVVYSTETPTKPGYPDGGSDQRLMKKGQKDAGILRAAFHLFRLLPALLWQQK